MEDFKKIEDLIDHAKEYVHIRIDEAKLTTAEKTSKVIAMLIAGTTVTMIFWFSLLFLSIAAAFILGRWLSDVALGFLIISAGCLLLGVIVWAAKGKLIRLPVMNAIIQQLFKTEDHNEKN